MNTRTAICFVVFQMTYYTALAAAPREVTIDDYFSVANLSEPVIAPAGDKVAFLDARWQESSNDRKADVWLAHADGSPPTRLTFDGAGYSQLTWSPDGRYLYFAGERKHPSEKTPPFDDSKQVWRLSIDGGQPVAVTRSSGGIGAFKLSADGESLFFTTSSTEFTGTWATLCKQFGDIKYGVAKTPKSAIWKLDLGNWRTDKVAEYAGYVDDLAIAPDKSRLALITAPNDEVITLEGQTRLTILDAAAGTTSDLPDDVWRRNAPSPFGRLFSPQWAADGKVLAFSVGFDGYPSEVLIADWQTGPVPRIKQLPRPTGVSLLGSVDAGAQLAWRGKSHDLCLLGEQQARIRAYVVRDVLGTATSEVLTAGDVVVESFSISASGDQLAAVTSGPTFMPDVYLFEKTAGKAITRVNPQISNWKLPKLSIVSWRGANGDNVEGVLELPTDYKPSTPLPVIVSRRLRPATYRRVKTSQLE